MFSYEVNEPADQAFGSVDENGTWSGMIGQILRNVNKITTVYFFAIFSVFLIRIIFILGNSCLL